ncbi:MAG: FecR domain-containing protein, partial [Bacteroidota bacterium]
EVAYRTISTERGQKRTVNLPDGSKIRLNYESQLKIPEKFADSARTVFLNGHAYFDIARKPDRPFIIYTENTKTQVLGTSFDINTSKKEGETEIIVTSGKVAFSEKGQEVNKVTLTVNDRAVLSADRSISTSEVHANRLTAWIDNRIIFDGETLEEIIQVLEPWYDVQITVENEVLLTQDFKFSKDNPTISEVLDRLSFLGSFNYQMDGNKIVLY